VLPQTPSRNKEGPTSKGRVKEGRRGGREGRGDGKGRGGGNLLQGVTGG